jgi:mono/diheme cytochrome c family protein
MHLPKSTGPRSTWIAMAALALFAAFAPHQVSAQVAFTASDHADDVTYTRDVAPIIQQNCQVCHRPGGIGPMDLVSYDDARRYARRIREQVANRIMPPYYYDDDVGIQALQHDWRLSNEDIATVLAWVDQGAVEGDPADLPVVDLPDTEDWSLESALGPPTLVVPSTPIDVPADGNDLWHRPFVPSGLTEDRCIMALQVKPAGAAKGVVHHANSTFQLATDDGFEPAGGGQATEYAMGKLGELIPDGVCRTMPANAYVAWDIHMYPGGLGAAAPNDVLEGNVVELGIWLHPADYEYQYKQDLRLYGIREGELVMPPHGTAMTQGFHSFDHPVRIDSFQPHGHLRMRSASLEVFYPETNRTEILSMVSNWSATWHQSHIYEADAAPLIPAGAVLVLKQWYDNTAGNPNNPDPDQWVDGGSRTADEMSHAWIAVTHLDEEGYERLLEERETQERNVTDQD